MINITPVSVELTNYNSDLTTAAISSGGGVKNTIRLATCTLILRMNEAE